MVEERGVGGNGISSLSHKRSRVYKSRFGETLRMNPITSDKVQM